jgi:myosin heavy subunit
MVDLRDGAALKGDPALAKAACADALRALGAARGSVQVGLSKVFFKRAAFELVEAARSELLGAAGDSIRAWAVAMQASNTVSASGRKSFMRPHITSRI